MIGEAKEVYNAVESKIVVTAGVSSPWWVVWLQQNRDDLFSWLIPILTAIYITIGILNRAYRWRTEWLERKELERNYLRKRRATDEEEI